MIPTVLFSGGIKKPFLLLNVIALNKNLRMFTGEQAIKSVPVVSKMLRCHGSFAGFQVVTL